MSNCGKIQQGVPVIISEVWYGKVCVSEHYPKFLKIDVGHFTL